MYRDPPLRLATPSDAGVQLELDFNRPLLVAAPRAEAAPNEHLLASLCRELHRDLAATVKDALREAHADAQRTRAEHDAEFLRRLEGLLARNAEAQIHALHEVFTDLLTPPPPSDDECRTDPIATGFADLQEQMRLGFGEIAVRLTGALREQTAGLRAELRSIVPQLQQASNPNPTAAPPVQSPPAEAPPTNLKLVDTPAPPPKPRETPPRPARATALQESRRLQASLDDAATDDDASPVAEAVTGPDPPTYSGHMQL